MNSTLWQICAGAIPTIAEAPSWLKEQALMSFEEVSQLPVLDGTIKGADSRPSFEEKVLKADYLDFLRGQIKLESRGPEWSQILKMRLAALEPFVEKKRISALFHRSPHMASIDIDPDTTKVIRFELH